MKDEEMKSGAAHTHLRRLGVLGLVMVFLRRSGRVGSDIYLYIHTWRLN